MPQRVPQEGTAGGHQIKLLRGHDSHAEPTRGLIVPSFTFPFLHTSVLFSLHISPLCNPLYPSISILYWKNSSSSHPCLCRLVASRMDNVERFLANVERFSHRKESDKQEHRDAASDLGSRPRFESRMPHRDQMIDSQFPYHSQYFADFFRDDDDVPLDAFGEQQSHPYQSCH